MSQPVGTIRVPRVLWKCQRPGCEVEQRRTPARARVNRYCSHRCFNLVHQPIRYAATPTDWTNFANRYRKKNDVGTVCRICGEEEFSVSKKRHHLDHDHATGRVRGLLCQGCNLRLGWYEKYSDQISTYLSEIAA